MSITPDAHDLARLIGAALEAQSALEEYLPRLEKSEGSSLSYGRKVIRDLKEALARFKP